MYQFVALLDPAGRLLEVNRAALEGGGVTLDAIRGKPFWDAHWWTVSREIQEQLRRATERAAQGEFVRYDAEIFGGARGNETIIIDFSLIPITDATGKVAFLLPEGRNITEKKRAEAELARKNQELEVLLERVKQLDELKSQLFANVSHELRTPLTLILGPADRMLEAGTLCAADRRDLELIRRNAAMLLKHVNDLLDIARVDAGQTRVRYAEVDLARLVRTIAGNFDALASAREITFVVEAPDRLMGEVDPDQVERIVLNLLSNAFKFVRACGQVKISLTSTAEGKAVIAVRDTGPGVPPELRQIIFERFRQGDGGSDRAFGGTGLGLAITKEFVELHGGVVTVTDGPCPGALFVVELPLRAPPGTPVRAARDEATVARTNVTGVIEELLAPDQSGSVDWEARGEGPVVLVVEDNADMRRFVAECFPSGVAVCTACDGAEGLEKARALVPDLIITDLMMPRMSGDRMIAEIRGESALAQVPILVLSAKADEALRIRLLRGAAQDYVVKPFAAEELRARAMNLVTTKRASDVLQAEIAGQSLGLEALAREVAAKKRDLEAALAETQRARDDAERANQVKTTFLGLVSHELRAPLTSILLQVERIERDKAGVLTPKQTEMLQRMSRSSRRLFDLVESLLEYTRLDAPLIALNVESIDVPALVAQVIDHLSPIAEQRGLTVDLASKEPLHFHSDPRPLRLILLNLIDNAIKYTDRGQVTVSLARVERALVVTVADTGIGIAEEHQARVFEPFEQIESTWTKHAPGVGLGLALVRRTVDTLGGRIALASRPGAGSVFTVTLPESEVAVSHHASA
jgi:PAS domain S-box-containing protein